MSTTTKDLPKVRLPMSQAERVRQMRDAIFDELRATALPAFEQVQVAKSKDDADMIARGFLAKVVGQFDALGMLERGEL
jgi:hypothetical protein